MEYRRFIEQLASEYDDKRLKKARKLLAELKSKDPDNDFLRYFEAVIEDVSLQMKTNEFNRLVKDARRHGIKWKGVKS